MNPEDRVLFEIEVEPLEPPKSDLMTGSDAFQLLDAFVLRSKDIVGASDQVEQIKRLIEQGWANGRSPVVRISLTRESPLVDITVTTVEPGN